MQIPGRRSHHNWPALHTALLLIGGIIPAYRCSTLPSVPVVVPSALFVLVCAIIAAAVCVRAGRSVLPSMLLVLCVPACGFTLGWEARSSQAAIPRSCTALPVCIAGEIVDQPMRSGNRVRFRLHTAVVLNDSISSTPDWELIVSIPAAGPGSADIPAFGDDLVVQGQIQPPRGPRNPGEFDEAGYYAANGIDGTVIIRDPRNVRHLDHDRSWTFMGAIIIPLREALRSHIDLTIGGAEGEFLKGLMIGDRGGLSPAIRDAFMVSGVAHILAVSGSNVAVVAAALAVLLSMFRIPRLLIPFPVTIGLFLYMFISGSQPSVVRATIMALTMLVASSSGWRGNGLNAVGLAALIMMAMDVRQLFDAGFLLSFGAVLSIMLLYPGLDALIVRRKGDGRIRRWAGEAFQLAAVSVASAIGTLPLTAVQFGRMSLVGFLANVPVVPVTGWSVVLGLCSAALGAIIPPAGASLAALNAVFLRATLWFVGICATMPMASMDMYWFDPSYALPLLALLGMWYHWRDAQERKVWLVGTLAALLIVVWLPRDREATKGLLRVSFIDCGQGDAALLEHPDGGAMLIDTGPVPADMRSGIVPFLLRRGITRLDAVVITHNHDDHAGGLRSVCSTFTVDRVLRGDHYGPGDTILWRPDCRLQVLYGPVTTDTVLLNRMNANRNSVVIRFVYGRTSFLFAADAEQPEELRMTAAFGAGVRCAVLKVGHHGSAAGTSDAWLDAVSPSIAVISVGARNRFGHPARSTLERLHRRGIHVCRTDEDGAVLMTTDGDTASVLSWR